MADAAVFDFLVSAGRDEFGTPLDGEVARAVFEEADGSRFVFNGAQVARFEAFVNEDGFDCVVSRDDAEVGPEVAAMVAAAEAAWAAGDTAAFSPTHPAFGSPAFQAAEARAASFDPEF
jgi:hypothetical protein